ncbi:hypothetical protein KP509_11G018800 [Ceratopteris richardii]|uniref:Pentatricopeptide repeat-containing protein n=1 Tax=Ceratopteris richardii TaxID=49495 RepID=A0A8T2TTC4_CERRI|nr:hypothetical protein KP509_11G018800 [Ceratopteris richardii]
MTKLIPTSALFRDKQLHESLEAACRLHGQDQSVFKETMLYILKMCAEKKDIKNLREVHDFINRRGLNGAPLLEVHIIRAYASCGSLHAASSVFHSISYKTVDSWNAIISAYATLGDGKSALDLFHKMQHEGVKPSTFAAVCVLKFCTSKGILGVPEASAIMVRHGIPVSKNIISCLLQGCLKTCDLAGGRHIHSLMIRGNLDSNSFLGDQLIRLFSDCGSLCEATAVFRRISKPSIYSWTAIISSHVKLGEPAHALELFCSMVRHGVTANSIVLLCLLKACEKLGLLDEGRHIHGQIIELDLERDVLIGNTLVFMYAKCGSLEEGYKLFCKLPQRDLVSWGAIITGYVKCEMATRALELYGMLKQEGLVPSKVIFLCTLKACTGIASLTHGRYVHNDAIISGFKADVNIGSTIVDMYAKCGSFEEASKVFFALPERSIVSWGAMIGGLAHHSKSVSALFLYVRMQELGIAPNRIIFLSVMKACACIGASKHSRLIHDHIIRSGIPLDVMVGSTLVDMYAKCNTPEAVEKVFQCLPEKNLVSWSAMIGAYTRVGNHVQAEWWLEKMQQEGLEPDGIILSSMLTAYSHAGLLQQGHEFFMKLAERYNCTPGLSHFNCIIDLLCRSGCLDEAEDMIASMPSSPDMVGWKALISGCKLHGNVQSGRQCFDELVKIDPNDAAGYMLMSNICAGSFALDEVEQIQVMRRFASAMKKPGTAWIEDSLFSLARFTAVVCFTRF